MEWVSGLFYLRQSDEFMNANLNGGRGRMVLILRAFSFLFVFTCAFLMFIPSSIADVISGNYCYTHGDNESLIEAKEMAKTLSIRNALESYRIFVRSKTEIKNFELSNDLVQVLSTGYLRNVRVVDEKIEGRRICVEIQADISPLAVEKLIKAKMQERTEHEGEGFFRDSKIKVISAQMNEIQLPSSGRYRSITFLVKAVQDIVAYKLFIDYFDSKGEIIGGGRIYLPPLDKGEVRRFEYPNTYFNTPNDQIIPSGAVSFRLWSHSGNADFNQNRKDKKTKNKR